MSNSRSKSNRYGNQRKMRSKAKVTIRRRDRRRLNRDYDEVKVERRGQSDRVK